MVITPRESDIYRKPNKLYLESKRGNNSERVGYLPNVVITPRESDIYSNPNRLYLVVRELTLSSEKYFVSALSYCSYPSFYWILQLVAAVGFQLETHDK